LKRFSAASPAQSLVSGVYASLTGEFRDAINSRYYLVLALATAGLLHRGSRPLHPPIIPTRLSVWFAEVDPRVSEAGRRRSTSTVIAGKVEDYDGAFERLHVEPGQHEIISTDGYRSLHQRRI
jgi:hypothetical protein